MFAGVIGALYRRWWAGLLGGALSLGLTYLAYENAAEAWTAGGRWSHKISSVVICGLLGFIGICCVGWGLLNLFLGDKWRPDQSGKADDPAEPAAAPDRPRD
jgi:hypothetical protein